MELVTAGRKKILSIPGAVGYTSDRIYKHRLENPLDATGDRAIVVDMAPTWVRALSWNGSEYPVLEIQYWADHDRDEYGSIIKTNAEEKAMAMHRVVDPVIHGKRGEHWGGPNGLYVIGCQRWTEPYIGDKNKILPEFWLDTPQEAIFLQVLYAMQVLHQGVGV